MRYLDYDTYCQLAREPISEIEFNRYELRAEREIDTITFNRVRLDYEKINKLPRFIEMLMLELIEIYVENNKQQITSMTNEGMSISYQEKEVSCTCDLIMQYLANEKDSKGDYYCYMGV